MKQIIILTFLSLLLTSSCMVSKEQVGNYDKMEGNATVYKKSKNIYLFWDLVPTRRVEKELTITDYEIVVKRNLFDKIIYYGTLGIFSFYTVKINIKESKEGQIIKEKMNE